MTDYRNVLERDLARVGPAPFGFDDVARRRDRKRRNKRIAAGVVGIAVFLAAAWIVRDVTSLDSTRTVVPAGTGTTGPAETGPAETGPTVSGPVIGNTGDPFSVGPNGLPPEGATPSEPLRGESVMSDGGIHPAYAVTLYADGRLIWYRAKWPNPGPYGPTPSRVIEQRLTPEGVELLRSGAVPLGGQSENPGEQLPPSAWEDPKLRPYVPSKYGACLLGRFGPPSQDLDVLPAWAQDLLSRTDGPFVAGKCQVVTIDDARALATVLIDAGFEETNQGTGFVGEVTVFTGSGLLGGPKGSAIDFVPILPDGTTYVAGG
jgi:hypothetical protein